MMWYCQRHIAGCIDKNAYTSCCYFGSNSVANGTWKLDHKLKLFFNAIVQLYKAVLGNLLNQMSSIAPSECMQQPLDV